MPEIRQMAELIAIGMGFPIDLVFGNGNYAGTSVSMRMLENFFLSNVGAQYRLMDWTVKRIGAFMNWPVPQARFKPFKMADDLQRQAFAFQLNQAGKISDSTLLSAGDFKVEDESELQMKETAIRTEATKKQQLAMAEIQGEASVIMAKYQAKAQQTSMEMQNPAAQELDQSPFGQAQSSNLSGGGGVGVTDMVNSITAQLQQLPAEAQAQQLQLIQQNQPEIAQLIQQKLQTQSLPSATPQVDTRPMPEQLPARRPGAV